MDPAKIASSLLYSTTESGTFDNKIRYSSIKLSHKTTQLVKRLSAARSSDVKFQDSTYSSCFPNKSNQKILFDKTNDCEKQLHTTEIEKFDQRSSIGISDSLILDNSKKCFNQHYQKSDFNNNRFYESNNNLYPKDINKNNDTSQNGKEIIKYEIDFLKSLRLKDYSLTKPNLNLVDKKIGIFLDKPRIKYDFELYSKKFDWSFDKSTNQHLSTSDIVKSGSENDYKLISNQNLDSKSPNQEIITRKIYTKHQILNNSLNKNIDLFDFDVRNLDRRLQKS